MHSSSHSSRRQKVAFTVLQRRLLFAFMVIICLLLIWGSVGTFTTAMNHRQTQAFLKDWQQKQSPPSSEAWSYAFQSANAAIRNSPTQDGRLHHELALVYRWKNFFDPFGTAEASESREKSLLHMRTATELLPTWPRGWMDLSWSKLYLLQLDSEFEQAIQKAHSLAPNNTVINQQLAQLGLIAWPSLSEQAKIITLRGLELSVKGSKKGREYLNWMIQETQMSSTVCEQASNETRSLLPVCARTAIKG